MYFTLQHMCILNVHMSIGRGDKRLPLISLEQRIEHVKIQSVPTPNSKCGVIHVVPIHIGLLVYCVGEQ